MVERTLSAVATATPLAAPAAPARRAYIPEFDVMRGAAIVFVVYLHSYFSPWEVTPHREVVAMHVIHLFAHTAVPVFFFMSAFLLAGDTSPSFGTFLIRKARRVAVPMAFWMCAALAYRAWREGGLDHALVKSFLYFDIAGQFYFLVVLLFFTVAFYFLLRWPLAWLKWFVVAAFVANLATVAYYETSTISGDFATFAYRNPLVWVFSFALGFYLGRRDEDLAWTRRWLWPAIAAMGVVMLLYLAIGERWSYPTSYFGVLVFAFSCLSLVVFPALVQVALERRPWRVAMKPIAWLSGYAFAIYLVHMPFFVGYLTNRVIPPDQQNEDFFRKMNLLFAIGFAGSLAFVVAASFLAPRFAEEFLGMAPRRRAGERANGRIGAS